MVAKSESHWFLSKMEPVGPKLHQKSLKKIVIIKIYILICYNAILIAIMCCAHTMNEEMC